MPHARPMPPVSQIREADTAREAPVLRPFRRSSFMLSYIRTAQQLRKSDKGASAVEYGILVAAIAAVIVALVFALGTQVKSSFKGTCDSLKTGLGTASTTTCP